VTGLVFELLEALDPADVDSDYWVPVVRLFPLYGLIPSRYLGYYAMHDEMLERYRRSGRTRAQEIMADEEMRKDSAAWFRPTLASVNSKADGLSLATSGLRQIDARLALMAPESYTTQQLPQQSVRVIRDGVEVYSGAIGSLRRFKDDVKEVREGFECGIGIENFNDVKVGDVIECFRTDQIARTL